MGKRVGLLDEARGIAVISMVIYHLYFDLRYFYGVELPSPVDTFMHAFQPFIAGTFIVVAGAASRYSSNNLRRGAIVYLVGMGFTVATAFLTPYAPITFGVLHLLGASMVIYGLIGRFTERIPSFIGVVLFALLFALTRGVPRGFFGIEGLFTLALPSALYTADLYWGGFPSAAYAALDYFPLIPYFFLFMAGAGLGGWFKSGRAPRGFYMTRFNALAWVGRHALLIYILHQPILVAIQEVVFKMIGRETMFL
ncbi:MAG: DUF1624 domain-containing protein [Bacteroides sp.]|nr:DUF1624 domain-containing protein [Eubacterium sp.]MCM1419312.1 DUF1624 domain-containing protein [Roseburia sp.]MCM1463160.1 DUF1624 domain-containing protein [Bacteroides sp.]